MRGTAGDGWQRYAAQCASFRPDCLLLLLLLLVWVMLEPLRGEWKQMSREADGMLMEALTMELVVMHHMILVMHMQVSSALRVMKL